MRARCNRRSRPDFLDYGGRGIRVCDEWNHYPTFRDWAIGAGYCEGLSLDRIDVDGDYEPSNCRWADWFTQARNKRNNHVLTAFGETKTLADWAEDNRCAVSYHTLKARLNICNMEPEYALTAPIHRLRRKVART